MDPVDEVADEVVDEDRVAPVDAVAGTLDGDERAAGDLGEGDPAGHVGLPIPPTVDDQDRASDTTHELA